MLFYYSFLFLVCLDGDYGGVILTSLSRLVDVWELGADIELGAAVIITIGVMALSLVPRLFIWLVRRITFFSAPGTVLQPERWDWLWPGPHKRSRAGITINEASV